MSDWPWKSPEGRGEIELGDSLDVLRAMAPGSVDLIMTSPPYGLVRKKDYGNENADDYCAWFDDFAAAFFRVLRPSGSFVLNLGGSWNKGRPTRSLYPFRLLARLVRKHGFQLRGEYFWWNPSRLPTPAEWVTVRRIRVKDAIEYAWWLSVSDAPKADFRAVRGTHEGNLIAISNTASNNAYQRYCRANGLVEHPARYPGQLPEFFIRLLTDPGDFVVDPFGGSCVTGAEAERLDRRWKCIELREEYLLGALGRFQEIPTPKRRAADRYRLDGLRAASPGLDDDDPPLDPAGGERRKPRPQR